MSNHLGQIYSTTKNAEKYIVLNSQNVELSGNVKLTNGNLDVSQNLIFSNFSVTDKINFRENSGSTSYNIINNSLTVNNDASLNNVDICGNLKVNGLAYSIPHILEIYQVEISTYSTSMNPYAFGSSNKVDTANGWNSNTNKYTIPTTGYWHVISIIRGETNGSANFTHSIKHYNALTQAETDIANGRALFNDIGTVLFETTGNDASTIRYLYSGDNIWFSIDSFSNGSGAYNNNFFGDGGKTDCGFRAIFLRK